MKGFVLFFTGLSGSGKSTLATLVARALEARGRHVEILDGDAVRAHLSKGLGFSREDRDENIRRIGFVAGLVARAGGVAISAAIAPYRAVRDELRRGLGSFVEVYCKCSIEALAARDPKGLYQRALRGEIPHFTGVTDPYEEPLAPEVEVDTERLAPEQGLALILSRLEALGLLDAQAAPAAELAPPWGPLALDAGDAAAQVDAPWDALCARRLLAPVLGAMNEKDAHKVQRERRLESGLPFPLVVTGRGGALPLREPSAHTLRDAIAGAGFAHAAGIVLRDPVDAASLHLCEFGWEVCERVVAVVGSDAGADAVARAAGLCGAGPRTLVLRAEVPRLTGVDDALLQVIVLRNLGLRHALLDAAPGGESPRALLAGLEAQRELGVRIVAAGPARPAPGPRWVTPRLS